MSWEKIETRYNKVSMPDVYIDYDAGLIKRHFVVNGSTCEKQPKEFTEQEITDLFNNEVYWLDELESKWIPETISIDNETQTIIQKYYGPCLLEWKPKLHEVVPDIEEQIIEMYKFFKLHSVYKCNGSLSNLTYHNGQVIAFDFKWAKHYSDTRPVTSLYDSPTGLMMEIKTYEDYLSKINDSLPETLKKILNV